MILASMHTPWWAYRGRGAGGSRIVTRVWTNRNSDDPTFAHGTPLQSMTLKDLRDGTDGVTVYWDAVAGETVESLEQLTPLNPRQKRMYRARNDD